MIIMELEKERNAKRKSTGLGCYKWAEKGQ